MIGAFIVLLLIYGTLWTPGTGYLMQKFSQCSFSDNKEGNITFDSFFTVNRQTVLSYNKTIDKYVPCPLGCIDEMEAVAENFSDFLNANPDTATQVKKEEERCKEEVKTFWDKTVERTAKPSVEVFLPVQVHPDGLPVLVCEVWGFYPQDISVAWFKNDKLVKKFTEAVRTGDWTYRILVTLDLRDSLPEDNYTCVVNHRSLDTPIVKTWKHGLTNIQIIKISVASVVFALGLVCFITGIVCWKNAQRSEVSRLPEGSVTNVSTSPLLHIPSQSLVEEDLDLGEESETYSVQGELLVREMTNLSSWGASSVPFYQGCALKDGNEEQANDRRCVPI